MGRTAALLYSLFMTGCFPKATVEPGGDTGGVSLDEDADTDGDTDTDGDAAAAHRRSTNTRTLEMQHSMQRTAYATHL